MSLTIVFPGQGSQTVGMGKDLIERYPEARDMFDVANEKLGRDLAKICTEGPEDVLTQTENAQVGLFLVSAILLEQLKKKGIEASYYAGHSLGELTACYAAGVYSLETAIDLVIARGRFMSAYSDGAMAAILGTDLSNLESELVEFESDSVVVANYNFSGQYVISGSKIGVEKACDKLQGLSNVKRVIPLKVGGPFHSPFMSKASEQFKDFVAPLTFNNAQVPIILNRTALTETQGSAIKENLPLQICSAVKWYQSIEKIAPSTTTFIECGSGKVLTGLIKKILKGVSVQSVSDCETLDALDLVLKGV